VIRRCQCKCVGRDPDCRDVDVRLRVDLWMCRRCRWHWDQGVDFMLEEGEELP